MVVENKIPMTEFLNSQIRSCRDSTGNRETYPGLDMRFYSLSENPNKPCYVVQFKQLSIMLDCGLDLSSWQHYLPLPGQTLLRLITLALRLIYC